MFQRELIKSPVLALALKEEKEVDPQVQEEEVNIQFQEDKVDLHTQCLLRLVIGPPLQRKKKVRILRMCYLEWYTNCAVYYKG